MSVKPAQILTTEGAIVIPVRNNALGQDLFTDLCSRLGISNASLFGLQYTDKKDHQAFLNMEKKIVSQDMAKDDQYHFIFSCQFFPESIDDEVTDPVLLRLFWKQIRTGVVKDDIYCPPELCVLFAAQSMQADHGDLNIQNPIHVEAALLLPPRVLAQHGFTPDEWAGRISNAWLALSGHSREEVIKDYVNIAQDLEQYGIHYFEVTNKRGTKLWLGVHNMGMDVYEYGNKVTPKLGFPWAEIKNIAFNDKKFKIKMVKADAPDFKFYSTRFKVNKRILALCVGNHKLFVNRRKAQMLNDKEAENRQTFEAKLKKTKEQLMAIRMDLESVKDRAKMTMADLEHEKNEQTGMDKYKTLKKAQSGDPGRRVQQFIEMSNEHEC